jgi:hypothetical protein
MSVVDAQRPCGFFAVESAMANRNVGNRDDIAAMGVVEGEA